MFKNSRSYVALFTLTWLFIAFSVTAFAAPTITSVTPNTADNWGMVEITEIAGTGFEEWAMVSLTRDGQPDIYVFATTITSSSIGSCMLDLRGEEPGAWDVVVTNPDEQSTTLVGGFTLTVPPAPIITSNTPDLSDNVGIVAVELTGDNFLQDAHVKLTRAGQPDVGAIYVAVESPTSITCKFNLTETEPGHWDIVVTNPDGQNGISNSIDIIQGSVDCTSIVGNTDFYVDDDGDNTNDGLTPATAWKTITYAINRIATCIPSPSAITLHVAAGTYDPALGETFPITMLDGVSLAGAGAETTILDAQGTGGVISCYNINTGETIEGFLIKNGLAWYGGSGISCNNSSPTIANCTITSNTANRSGGGGIYCIYNSAPMITSCTIMNNTTSWSGGGGGIGCRNSSPTITNCTISGNTANSSGGGGIGCRNSSPTITNCIISGNATNSGGGGGIGCRWSSSPMIVDCIINSNTANRGGGGGIEIRDLSSLPTIKNCTISGNTANSGFGGGIYCSRSAPTITGCIISGNTANSGYGGGISCWAGSPAIITNCIINGNIANHGGGGGIFCSSSSPTITNCTISSNNAYTGGGIYTQSSSSFPTVLNSILWGDSSNEIHLSWGATIHVSYSDVQGGWIGEGNINSNPLFVDPASGDYHLQSNSPCINVGTVTDAPEYDFEGDPRLASVGGDDMPDMGADEVLSTCDPQGISGSIAPSQTTLWPPNHNMIPLTISASLVTDNEITSISITDVDVMEYSNQEASEAAGENIYDENNFEPDWEITGNLSLNLRSERSGPSTGRTYTITVTATDCSGDYTFTTEVVVPHDKGK